MRAFSVAWMLFLALVPACKKKEIDPAYKAAIEARMRAYCDCAEKPVPDEVDCYRAAEALKEPDAPGGEPAGLYEDSLRSEDKTFVRKMLDLRIDCSRQVSRRLAEYKDDQQGAAKAREVDDTLKKMDKVLGKAKQ